MFGILKRRIRPLQQEANPPLLFKYNPEATGLSKIFDYDGFSLYNFRNPQPDEQLNFPAKDGKEALVFSLKNEIAVNQEKLAEKDMAYVPVGDKINISTPKKDSMVYIVESNAAKKYNFYIKKYANATRMQIGEPTYRRTVVVSIAESDMTNRFIGGYVENSNGEWSSYPPHKHDDKPEVYIYYGIDPGYAVQLILDERDEKAFVVHDYDAVLIRRGYHPHVNTSLKGGCYAWVVSAPPENKRLDVKIHPAYGGVKLGRSHLTTK